ncbi:hypothetical protein KAI46_04810 [bacterium]|nr:hypothetical protein [bacterium]
MLDQRNEVVKNIIAQAGCPIISRKEAARLSGGLISEKTLANLDCLGEGPTEKIRIGKRVGYPTEVFATWFSGQIKTA